MATKPPAPAFAAAWNTAVAHHQAGRLKEAEQLYRQVLAAAPQHYEARHLLGVVALQSGRLDEAATLIAEALAANPKLAAAHNNLGNVRLRQGRDAEAMASFQKAVQVQPSFGDAHYNLANLYRKAGRFKEASTHFLRATASNAKWFDAHLNLGATLLDLGDARGAVKAFETAVRIKPDHADALSNLGVALSQASELTRALEVLARALKADPKSVNALLNQGMVLGRMGRVDEARRSLEQAIALDGGNAAAHANLGTLLLDNGSPDEAITWFERALKLEPTLVEAQVGLSLALQAAGREKEALAASEALRRANPGSSEALVLQGRLCLERQDLPGAETALQAAVAAQPSNAEAHYLLGNTFMQAGRWREAVDAYDRAVRADSNHLRARWALTMNQLPPVPANAAEVQKGRSSFARMLGELDKWFDASRTPQGHVAVGSTQPFYLAYAPLNGRELLSKYGALCARLMRPWQESQHLVPTPRAAGRPLRIGIASSHVYEHSVWNAVVSGWIRHLDRSRFQLHIYHLGTTNDARTAEARQLAHKFESGSKDVLQWARTIVADQLDVLIHPEIGMGAMAVKLASMRLAPVQAASWGHPQTTGLPTIDHYLSASDLEPPNGQDHYSEKLVRLPNLGVCYEPRSIDSTPPDLRALGVPDTAPLLLCPGTAFKYQPEQDRVWSEIARRAPGCRLVFFVQRGSDTGPQLSRRLEQHFKSAGLDFASHVSFIPFLDQARFFGLMQRAHLFLDTIHFSGFNTAMQAIECGLPIVTREGDFMRGRLASALLRRMGLDELVTRSDDDYIERVVELACDAARRNALAQKIVAGRSALFGDRELVRALEQFLESVGSARG